MATLDALGCETCRLGSSNYEDKYNKGKQEPQTSNGWWFCSNARSPHGVSEHGKLLWLGKPCQANYCPECGPRNVTLCELGLHIVQPTVFVTINDVSTDHHLGRVRMTAFRRACNEWGAKFENAYSFERYTERGRQGLHVHLLGLRDLPSQETLDYAADKAGFDPLRKGTRVDRQEVIHHGNLGYLLKSAREPSTRATYLYDNGGRLLSTTRGFWKSPDGQIPAGGLRGLLRATRSRT